MFVSSTKSAALLVIHMRKDRLAPFRVFVECRLLLQVQAFALEINFIVSAKIAVQSRCSLRHQ